MLKKEFRVKSTRDFQKIYKKGNYIGGSLFNINFISNRQDISRIAVVISKKVSKKAVTRNKIKRKVREAMREIYPKLKNGFDIVINIKIEAEGKKFEELKKSLEEQLKKKGLL